MVLPRPQVFDIPLSEEDLQLLGLICVFWSQFEFVVELGLYTLLKIGMFDPKQPRDISAKIVNLKTFIETKIVDKARRKHMLSVCDRGIAAALRRNLAVHGKWAADVNTQKPVAVSWFQVKPPDPLNILAASELSALAEEITSLTREMHEFLIAEGALTQS
jgi:hypothetical protein